MKEDISDSYGHVFPIGTEIIDGHYYELAKTVKQGSVNDLDVTVCVHYFLFFQQMIALQKLWKMPFISPKKLFSFSRYPDFCNFFPCFPYFSDLKGQMKVEQFIISWIGLHKVADVNFGMTQNLFYITSSDLVK